MKLVQTSDSGSHIQICSSRSNFEWVNHTQANAKKNIKQTIPPLKKANKHAYNLPRMKASKQHNTPEESGAANNEGRSDIQHDPKNRTKFSKLETGLLKIRHDK